MPGTTTPGSTTPSSPSLTSLHFFSRRSTPNTELPLPPYETSRPPMNRNPMIGAGYPAPDATHLIGGAGVRFPFGEEAKETFDRSTLKKFEKNSAYWIEPGAHKPAVRNVFDAAELYKAAASQIDILLPLLSSPASFPFPSTHRTITLRLLPLPPPDVSYVSKILHRGCREGRRELDEAYKGWVKSWGRGPENLWILADAIARRIMLDGYIVTEEWWNLVDSTVQFVVRC